MFSYIKLYFCFSLIVAFASISFLTIVRNHNTTKIRKLAAIERSTREITKEISQLETQLIYLSRPENISQIVDKNKEFVLVEPFQVYSLKMSEEVARGDGNNGEMGANTYLGSEGAYLPRPSQCNAICHLMTMLKAKINR